VIRITVFGTYQGVSAIVSKASDWKRSRIFLLEVEGIRQSCIPYFEIGLNIVLYKVQQANFLS
jgi:hypothetical protein